MRAEAIGCAAQLDGVGRERRVIVWTALAAAAKPGRIMRPLPRVDLDELPPIAASIGPGLHVLDGDVAPVASLEAEELLTIRSGRTEEHWQLPGLRAWVRLHRGGSSTLAWPAPHALVVSVQAKRAWLAYAVFGEEALGAGPIERISVGLLPGPSTRREEEGDSRSPLAAVPIIDHTGASVGTFPFETKRGRTSLVVVAKATYKVGAALELAAEQRPLSGEAVDDPNPKAPDDFVPIKEMVDVLVVGCAYPTAGAKVARVDLSLDAWSTSFVALGERSFGASGVPTEPATFERLELTWEHALAEPPRIEDPQRLLRARGDARTPVCPAPVPRDQLHRKNPAGTFGDAWAKSRWPALPDDFDPAYFQSADRGQRLASIRGDEPFAIKGVRPGGEAFEGHLPGQRVRAFAFTKGGRREVSMKLDTVLFDGEAQEVILTWRGRLDVADASASDVARVVMICESLEEPLVGERLEDVLASPAERPGLRPRSSADRSRSRGPVEASAPRERRLALMRAHQLVAVPRMLLPEDPPVFTRTQIAERIRRRQSLAACDLSGADLRGLDFSGVDLRGATLIDADVRGCSFDGALGDGVRAMGVNAAGSTFREAQLSRALFACASLAGCDFSNAKLPSADFSDADLTNAKFERADLTRTKWVRVKALRVNAQGANAPGLDASDASLEAAVFADAALQDARFDGCHAVGAVLDRAILTNSRWERAHAPKASLKNARAQGAAFELADLTEADLRGADLSNAILAGATLVRANLGGVLAKRALLLATNATGAVFQGADLMWAKIERCMLERATFHGANVFEVSWLGSTGLAAGK